MSDAIKVAVCEAIIRLNGDDPIIPPTAVNWIGDAIASGVLGAPDVKVVPAEAWGLLVALLRTHARPWVTPNQDITALEAALANPVLAAEVEK